MVLKLLKIVLNSKRFYQKIMLRNAYYSVSMIKTEPDDQDQGFLPDLKAVNHNHTYNGTAGVKKQEKQ